MSASIKDEIEKLTDLIDPSVEASQKTEAKIRPQFILIYLIDENNPKYIYKMNSKILQVSISGGKLEIEIKTNITKKDIGKVSQDIENEFINLLNDLKDENKKIIEKLNNNEKKNYYKVSFIFDTCYDKNKARNLAQALGKIELTLCGSGNPGCDLFKKFLLLLAGVYARMAVDAKYFERVKWFPLLVRAAAGNSGYVPVCPSKGDAVAIVYYYVTKFGVSGDRVEPQDVVNMLVKLANLP